MRIFYTFKFFEKNTAKILPALPNFIGKTNLYWPILHNYLKRYTREPSTLRTNWTRACSFSVCGWWVNLHKNLYFSTKGYFYAFVENYITPSGKPSSCRGTRGGARRRRNNHRVWVVEICKVPIKDPSLRSGWQGNAQDDKGACMTLGGGCTQNSAFFKKFCTIFSANYYICPKIWPAWNSYTIPSVLSSPWLRWDTSGNSTTK